MRYAILGGSFNPVHNGHLYLAGLALAEGYDCVIMIPANQSPFKPHLPLQGKSDKDSPLPPPCGGGWGGVSPQDRLDMLAASIPPAMPITIDDCEINREGVSYTIDTVKDIIKRYGPDGKLGLILGNDLKQDFHLWKNAEEIQSLCDILWKDRLGDISSTLVRKKIENNEEWRYLVPNGARYIIEDRNLYTSSLRASAPPREIFQLINRIETEVRALVNTTRYIHSRSVAITATALARHFGLDPSRAYLAGIAHDIAKQIEPGPMTHGKAGAQLLKDRFGFGKNEKDILEAVEKHTTGAPGMCDLAKIIYISDKIEPARRKVRPEYRNLGLWPTIDSLLACVIEDVFEILKEKGKIPSPDTIKLLEGLQ